MGARAPDRPDRISGVGENAEVVRPDWFERCQRSVAGNLRRLDLVPGDRIGVCMPSSGRQLALITGALRCGLVPVVANVQLTLRERTVIQVDARPQRWVDDAAQLMALTEGPPGDLAAVPLGRPMHYTSGTTGRPKGVFAGVLSEDLASRWWGEEREQWGFERSDVHLVCSPLQHSAPIRFAVATLLAGGTVLVPDRFDVVGTARVVEQFGVTTTFCTPAHLQRLAEGEALGALRRLRLVAHAGAPCPPLLKRAAIGQLGSRLWEFYGSTEGQFTSCGAEEWLERPGTVGRARPGRSMSVDRAEVLWCTAPPWARWEYWRDASRTAEAWDGDRFTVGDLGRIDPDGYVHLTARRSDLIVTGGVNVYPAEVEQVLATVPGVDDIAVFGRDDERWGQRVAAAYTGAAAEATLRRVAESTLAPFKRPKDYHRVEAIPRIGLAKVRRSTLARDLGLDGDR